MDIVEYKPISGQEAQRYVEGHPNTVHTKQHSTIRGGHYVMSTVFAKGGKMWRFFWFKHGTLNVFDEYTGCRVVAVTDHGAKE